MFSNEEKDNLVIRFEALKNKVLSKKRIKDKVIELKLSDNQIKRAMPILLEMYNEDIDNMNVITSIYLSSRGAPKRKNILSQKGKKKEYLKNVVTLDLYKVDFEESEKFDKTKERFEVVKKLTPYLKGQAKKGIYLYGQMGIGKTFILKRFAKKLAEHNKKVGFINLSSMVKTVQDSFGTEKRKLIEDQLSTVEFLFIDDIGAETISYWFRDDFLFVILNNRMENNKITFFSSNYDQNKLIQIQAKEAKNSIISKDKSSRMVDRVKALSEEILLKGKNRRH